VIDADDDASVWCSPTAPAPVAAANIEHCATGGNGVAKDFIVERQCKRVEIVVAEDPSGRLVRQAVADARNI
jgi:hypothetical protein